MSIVKRGMTGAPVKRLQEALGVGADGIFGPGTEKALKSYQSDNGLAADGIAGPDTFTAMGLHELVLLRQGSRGATVKKMQEALGIGADGIFGPGTRKAVVAFQEANGLAADGMCGPLTLAAMDDFKSTFTQDTLAKAEVTPEEEATFEAEPMPQISGVEFVSAAEAEPEPAPKKSLWGRVKGWWS